MIVQLPVRLRPDESLDIPIGLPKVSQWRLDPASTTACRSRQPAVSGYPCRCDAHRMRARHGIAWRRRVVRRGCGGLKSRSAFHSCEFIPSP